MRFFFILSSLTAKTHRTEFCVFLFSENPSAAHFVQSLRELNLLDLTNAAHSLVQRHRAILQFYLHFIANMSVILCSKRIDRIQLQMMLVQLLNNGAQSEIGINLHVGHERNCTLDVAAVQTIKRALNKIHDETHQSGAFQIAASGKKAHAAGRPETSCGGNTGGVRTVAAHVNDAAGAEKTDAADDLRRNTQRITRGGENLNTELRHDNG